MTVIKNGKKHSTTDADQQHQIPFPCLYFPSFLLSSVAMSHKTLLICIVCGVHVFFVDTSVSNKFLPFFFRYLLQKKHISMRQCVCVCVCVLRCATCLNLFINMYFPAIDSYSNWAVIQLTKLQAGSLKTELLIISGK